MTNADADVLTTLLRTLDAKVEILITENYHLEETKNNLIERLEDMQKQNAILKEALDIALALNEMENEGEEGTPS